MGKGLTGETTTAAIGAVTETAGYLAIRREIILPSYIGPILSHYKDAYEPITIIECHKGFRTFAHFKATIRILL